MSSYLADHGYLDGVVRGFCTQLLTEADYANLTSCETIEDMKTHLMATDYASVFQDVPSPLTVQAIADACNAKMVEEFQYIRANAYKPLDTFMDYITYGYMIDNIMLILSETLRNGNPHAQLIRCHPLGLFEGLTALCTAQDAKELYHFALVNTPLAKYFLSCLTVEDLDDIHIEIIRNLLCKEYLVDFYNYTQTLNTETAESMKELLFFEADRRSINITVNSWSTSLPKDERKKLYPTIGELYPEGIEKLQMAEEMDSVSSAVDSIDEYRIILSSLQDHPYRTLEDEFIEREMKLNRVVSERQFQYGVFYSYFRMKEHEIRNIVYIADCISQKKRDRINNFIMV